MKNPKTLLSQVTSGALATPPALKAEYRRRWLAVHPDHGASDGEAFLALQADYQASRRLLEDQSSRAATTPAPFGFLDTFFEFVSLGLLDDRRFSWRGRAATRLQRVTDLFDHRPGGAPGDFVRALGEIGGEGPRELLHAMLSYRYNPWKHARAQILKRLGEVKEGLSGTGRVHGLALVGILAAELLATPGQPQR